MSIRQFQPMTPATRFRSVSGFRRDHPEARRRSRCSSRCKRHRRPQQPGPRHRRGTRAAGTSGSTAGSTSSATSSAFRPRWRRSSTIRTAPRGSRCCVYADGEKRYILHPKGLNVGDTVVSGPGSDIRTGNAMPLVEIPLGTTVHNIELKIGKGGQLCRARGHRARRSWPRKATYVTLRLRSTEMRLVHARVPRHDRRGRQRGARAAVGRQGGEEPLAGPAAARARRRHEPGGSPARRRRRQELGRPSADVALGQAGRQEDPASEEEVDETHRARA